MSSFATHPFQVDQKRRGDFQWHAMTFLVWRRTVLTGSAVARQHKLALLTRDPTDPIKIGTLRRSCILQIGSASCCWDKSLSFCPYYFGGLGGPGSPGGPSRQGGGPSPQPVGMFSRATGAAKTPKMADPRPLKIITILRAPKRAAT